MKATHHMLVTQQAQRGRLLTAMAAVAGVALRGCSRAWCSAACSAVAAAFRMSGRRRGSVQILASRFCEGLHECGPFILPFCNSDCAQPNRSQAVQLRSRVTRSEHAEQQQPSSGMAACPRQSHSCERMRSACSATSSTPGRLDGSVSKHRMTSCLHGWGTHGQGWHRCCGRAVRARTHRGSSIGRKGQSGLRSAHKHQQRDRPSTATAAQCLWHSLEAFRAAGRHIIWPAHAAAVPGPDESSGRMRSMAGGGQNCMPEMHSAWHSARPTHHMQQRARPKFPFPAAERNASAAQPPHLTTASIRLPPASPAARSNGLCPHSRK